MLSVWGQSPKVHQLFLMISFIAKKPPKNLLVISKEPCKPWKCFLLCETCTIQKYFPSSLEIVKRMPEKRNLLPKRLSEEENIFYIRNP